MRFFVAQGRAGGGITAGGLVNYANWSNSAQPVFSVSNKTGYVLGSRGETFAEGRWTLGGDGAGAASRSSGGAACRISCARDGRTCPSPSARPNASS